MTPGYYLHALITLPLLVHHCLFTAGHHCHWCPLISQLTFISEGRSPIRHPGRRLVACSSAPTHTYTDWFNGCLSGEPGLASQCPLTLPFRTSCLTSHPPCPSQAGEGRAGMAVKSGGKVHFMRYNWCRDFAAGNDDNDDN